MWSRAIWRHKVLCHSLIRGSTGRLSWWLFLVPCLCTNKVSRVAEVGEGVLDLR